jgi:sigma-B regulation protein RsbU (phosphoserine phosphatase)
VASGGHELPVRVAAGVAEPTAIGRAGSLLGVLDDPELHDTAIDLQPGDVLTFFTDGVTEGRRGPDFFGDDRLKALLAASRQDDAATIARRIVDEVVDFQSGAPRDDIAVVVVRVPDEPA